MDFEKKLNQLSAYNIAFEIKQGYYHVCLVYNNNNWEIMESDNENLYIEKRNGICHYIGETNKVTIDEIFASIQSTIDYNIDLENKLILFRQKTEELQELFSKEDIEKLRTIRFEFGEKEEKKKRGRKPKKENQKSKETDTKEETVEKVENSEKETEEISNPQQFEEETQPQINEEEDIVIMNEGYMEELERE